MPCTGWLHARLILVCANQGNKHGVLKTGHFVFAHNLATFCYIFARNVSRLSAIKRVYNFPDHLTFTYYTAVIKSSRPRSCLEAPRGQKNKVLVLVLFLFLTSKGAFTLRTTSYVVVLMERAQSIGGIHTTRDVVRRETQKSRYARSLRTFVRTTSYVPALPTSYAEWTPLSLQNSTCHSSLQLTARRELVGPV